MLVVLRLEKEKMSSAVGEKHATEWIAQLKTESR
jgi:hypothetical protein